MAVKFTNNAATTLAAGINSSATSIAVTDGSIFPALSGSDYFYVTFDDTTNREIVKVTARSGNTLTAVRGQDDTTAQAFNSGDKAELRIVAALLEDVKTEVTSTLNVDAFTGDGTTTAFTLSQAPSSEDNLIVFIEGAYQNPGDFVLSGTTLTLDEAPVVDRNIIVYHVKGAVSGNNLNQDSFTGNGSTTAFTLSIAPIHENNTQIFIDGVYQQKNSYAVSGTTLTLDAAPANGAILEVMTFTQTEVNTLPANFVSGLTEVTAVGADHFMIFDATDSALKKSLVSDVLESATSISTSADATAITIDSSENVTFTNNVTINSGQLTAGGLAYPTSDGTNNQVLTTDGSGTLSFADGGVDGIVSSANATAITIDSNENIFLTGAGTGSRYLALNETSTYAGSLIIQAGGGSAAFGGAIIAYGNSHASKGGDIVAGISSGSGGNFRVNSSALDNGSDLLTVQASGNVGIGTASPAKELEVAVTGVNQAATVRIQGTDGNGTGHPLDLKMDGASDSFSVLIGQGGGATPDVVLFNGNRNGNVGIGTASPNTALHVQKLDTSSNRTAPINVMTVEAESNNLPYSGFGGSLVFKNRAYTSGVVESAAITSIIGNNSASSAGGNLAFSTTNTVSGSLIERARVDYNGNLLVGTTSGSTHIIKRAVSVGSLVLEIIGNNLGTRFFNADGGSPNAGNSAQHVYSVGATGRSINAAGTVNASGADYAEYMKKADSCGIIAKGDVCGVDATGKLTDLFADAISFVIKSTDPSYVGGDAWGGTELELTEEQYETERQKYDRIAFSGQVPVNITGSFNVGDYVYPQVNGTAIECVAKSSPTFEEYQLCVGKIWATQDDGRPFVAVKIG